jgi:hypothetical protein
MACCWLPAFTGFHRAGNVPLALERHRVASPSARAVPPCTSSSPNILALGAGVFALDVVLGHSKGTVRSAFLLGSHKYSAIVYSYMDDSAQTSNRQIASVVLLPAKSMNQTCCQGTRCGGICTRCFKVWLHDHVQQARFRSCNSLKG